MPVLQVEVECPGVTTEETTSKGRRPNFGRGPDYRNRTRLISDCSESVPIYGPLLPFPMLIIPLPIQSEPSTFQCVIMRLSDDMKYDRCIETCHERT